MAPPIETEIKIPLAAEADYLSVRRALGPPARARQQHNLFFDTPDHRLGRARWGLRLRKETDPEGGAPPRALAALKGPAQRAHGATRRVDLELEVDISLWERAAHAEALAPDALPAPIGALLHEQALLRDLRPLPCRIQFTNLRSSYPLELAGRPRLLLLDRTAFATGQVDFEVEVEVALHPTPGDPDGRVTLTWLRRDVLALLQRSDVTELPSRAGGKLSRAIRYAGG